MIPMAIECGMSIDEFWHSTDTEFHAYEKAYMNRMDQQAWLTGYYGYQAQVSVMSMILSKNKRELMTYPDQPLSRQKQDHQEKYQKKSAEQKDQEFRKILLECY